MYDSLFSFEESGRLRLQLRDNNRVVHQFIGGKPADWNDIVIQWMRRGKCDVTISGYQHPGGYARSHSGAFRSTH